MKRVLWGYNHLNKPIVRVRLKSLKDRGAGRLSFFMLCSVSVQIEYYNMEIMDAVDKIVTIYGTA